RRNSQGGVGHAKAGNERPETTNFRHKKTSENRTARKIDLQSKQDCSRAPLEPNQGQRKGQYAFTNPVRLPTQNPITTGSHASTANLIASSRHGSRLKWHQITRP